MNINPLILQVLNDIGCSVSPIFYKGSEDAYIVFSTYSEIGEHFADDEELAGSTRGSINIYTKGNFKTLEKEVKRRLKQAGFFVLKGPELYEQETGYYHVVLDFYIEHIEEE